MSFSIFGAKDPKHRKQGEMSTVGGTHFERHRRRLAVMFREVSGRDPARVSDSDTMEFLSRGDAGTRAYLEVHWKKL